MSTKQCFCNGNLVSIVAGSTDFNLLQSSGSFNNAPSSTEAISRQSIIPTAGKIRNLRLLLNIAITAGLLTVTLRVNAVDTIVTASIAAGLTGADLVNEVAVVAGDLVSYKIVSAPGTNTVQLHGYSIEYESDADNEFILMSGTSFQIQGSGGPYNSLIGMGSWNTSPVPLPRDAASVVLPMACTLQSVFVKLQNPPGVGNTWNFRIYRNGLQELSTLVIIADGATSVNLTGIGLAMAEGDLLVVRGIRTGSSPATRVCYGFLLDNVTDGESIMNGHTGGLLTNTPGVTEWNYHDRGGLGWLVFEVKSLAAIGFTMKKMRIWISAQQGFAWTRTFRNLVNGLDGNSVVAMTNFDKNKNDPTNVDVISAAGEIGIKHSVAGFFGSPPDTYALWSAVQFIDPAPEPAFVGRAQMFVSVPLGAIDL